MKTLAFLVSAVVISFAAPLGAFEGNIIPSKAQNIQDQWRGILPGRPPQISLCTRVVRLEPFSVNVFFSNPTVKDGKVHVSGKLKMRTPAGETAFETPLKPQMFPCDNPRSVFLFPDYVMVSFDPPDKEGAYTFIAELKDENSGTAVTAEAVVTLKGELSLPPDKDPVAAMSAYYRRSAPQDILPAFDAFLKMLPELKKKQGKNFNPMSTLAMFFYALKANPQLYADFAGRVETLTGSEGQFFGVVILHELGEKAFALLPESLRKRWDPRLAGVFVVKQVNAPWQLDILWSEFLVTGKKEPLAKIVGEIHNMEKNISIEDYKKLSDPTPEDRESLMRHLIGMAAAWSVGANARQHRLVAFYLEAMLARKEIPDMFTSVIVAEKLKGVEVRTAAPTPAK